MIFIRYLLIFVEVVSSILLLLAILIQKSRGYGIGTAFGGLGETVFGAQLGTVLTKITVILSIVFLLNTALLAFVGNRIMTSARSVTEKIPLQTAPVTRESPATQQPVAEDNMPVNNSGATVPSPVVPASK